ncbi:DUF3108 domain-containing protein [Cephaloticoccus primus]|nr:DUF3108 domain-containing protein [Cephaloticoccus primus]
MRRPLCPLFVFLVAAVAFAPRTEAGPAPEQAAAPPSPPISSEPLALGHGEQLHFQIAWGIFPKAGEIKISAEEVSESEPMPAISTDNATGRGHHFAEENGAPSSPRLLRISTTTRTRSTVAKFFRFRAQSIALFDTRSGLLLHSEEESHSRKKATRQSLDFDYPAHRAHYTNEVAPEESRPLVLPPGQPMDLITSLIQTRAWDLRPGESRDALVIFEDDFYELTIHATGYEELKTPLGRFRTLILEPRMERTEPKGMFKRGSTVKVWISQDTRRLPVRFQVEFKFGAGVATLVNYSPPEP